MNSFDTPHPFNQAALAAPKRTIIGPVNGSPPLLGRRFVPGHTVSSPILGQGPIQDILDSPWLEIGLKAGTAALLLALASATKNTPQILAIIGAAYWLFRTAEGIHGQVKEETPPTEPSEGEV